MNRTQILTAVAAGAVCIALVRSRRRTMLDLKGKVVLITGGSRGLGLALAREFGSHGAVVVICARNEAELSLAQRDLSARGIQSHAFSCDVADRDQVATLVTSVGERVGSVDVLVNNAGIIKVGPFSTMGIADFEQAMRVMFWGALNATLAVLPAMRARKRGSIVNITSVGGKVSVPHLLPYSCAKFAAVALSEGLRTELAPVGIRVTTIVPGLLRTGSHLKAEFKGNHAAEYAWFAAGATTPILSISAERAARSIVRATVCGEGEKILSVPADVLARLQGLLPGLTGTLLGVANGLLPSDKNGSKVSRPGADIEASFNSSVWRVLTKAGQNAAESLNEV